MATKINIHTATSTASGPETLKILNDSTTVVQCGGETLTRLPGEFPDGQETVDVRFYAPTSSSDKWTIGIWVEGRDTGPAPTACTDTNITWGHGEDDHVSLEVDVTSTGGGPWDGGVFVLVAKQDTGKCILLPDPKLKVYPKHTNLHRECSDS